MEYVWHCDLFIVFLLCLLYVDSEGYTFNAPSAGAYLFGNTMTTGFVWGEYVEVKTREANAVLYLVNPLGVQYAITIDDNGTITATEAT